MLGFLKGRVKFRPGFPDSPLTMCMSESEPGDPVALRRHEALNHPVILCWEGSWLEPLGSIGYIRAR